MGIGMKRPVRSNLRREGDSRGGRAAPVVTPAGEGSHAPVGAPGQVSRF